MTGGVTPNSFLHARGSRAPKAARFFLLSQWPVARRMLALSLILAGVVVFGQGIYIHAKALLAQVLLQRAFSETIASGRQVKPWPWADTWPIARIAVER